MNKHVFLSLFISLLLLFTQIVSANADELQPETKTALLNIISDQKVAQSDNEMVVTAHPLATQAAYNMLKKGGNAADAAIAAQLVLGLVEPQSSGIGGGGFVLYYDANTEKIYSIDGRETAPKSAHPRLFLDKNSQPLSFFNASTSKKSIGIPAMPELLFQMNRKFGTHTLWAESFVEAIDIAKSGFTVTPRLSDLVDTYQDRLIKNKSIGYFNKPDKTLIKPGDRIINPSYAETLTKFRDIGPRSISPHYNVKFRAPVCGRYRIYMVCSMGEPSSGGLTLLSILKTLNHYDLGNEENTAAYHHYIEASKLAFADRNQYMADPDYVDTPGIALINDDYLEKRKLHIRLESVLIDAPFGQPLNTKSQKSPHDGPEENGTTHISIIDRFGNAVSMTSSIEFAFGSGYMKNGYFLNNQLTDFSFMPEKNGVPTANRVEAGKRPRSSMTPVIVFNTETNKPIVVIGSAGGSRIIGYVAQRLIAILDWNISPKAALDMPSLLARGNTVEAEHGFSQSVLDDLKRLGHTIKQSDLNSGLTLIYDNGEHYIGAADPRREGTAAGR